jgi:hypothetical protein
MDNKQKVQSLEDCIRNRNLFLIHAGHSWTIIRATSDDSVVTGAIPLPLLNRLFPKAAMFNTIARIEDVPMLEKYMKAARVSKDFVIKQLNKQPDSSGYSMPFNVSGGMGPPDKVHPVL